MKIINDEIKELFSKIPIMVLSTADNNNVPNVVAIGSKKIISCDTIWTINTFHNKTIQNILQNENVAIAMWQGKKGYQIKGKAKYYSKGEIFEAGKKWILESKPDKIVKGVIEIKVNEVFSINPNYEDAGKLISSIH
ncbi:MAG: pyridoxamine 5'-phosphate oxidase family protein [Bacteroidales bacterium]|jgi:predicted pyridoxine 5'-phosphate oxidase superfamily flavin-nucleotide-binding protein|nr:pyridoxamine 5'-phosphate oxidase family protein [Bacteroidales bacterium]